MILFLGFGQEIANTYHFVVAQAQLSPLRVLCQPFCNEQPIANW